MQKILLLLLKRTDKQVFVKCLNISVFDNRSLESLWQRDTLFDKKYGNLKLKALFCNNTGGDNSNFDIDHGKLATD